MQLDVTWVLHKKIAVTDAAAVAAAKDATTVLRAYLNTLIGSTDLTTKIWTTLAP
jgi:hypothetical protein